MSILLNLEEEAAKQSPQARELTADVLAALQPHGLADRELQPQDSLAIHSAEDVDLVGQLVARYRALPAPQRRGLPALLNAVGKLEFVRGEFASAQKDFTDLAGVLRAPTAQAEAHHNAYLAALECRAFNEALAELLQAVQFDSDRFAPFPPDKFEAERILGASGCSVALLCRHRQAGGRFVVKTLRGGLSRHPSEVYREAQLLAALEHPAILRVRECDYADAKQKRLFVVMEYFPGRTLAQYVEQHGPLPVGQFLTLARLVAEGLRNAHQRGVLHRDVKPANLLVRPLDDGRRWEAKVINFGLTTEDASVLEVSQQQGDRTLAGTDLATTAEYAAPELLGRLDGVDPSPRSDVYAFASTCCFALFGTPQPTSDEWKKLPRPLADLLGRCLAEQPRKRPADFAEVLEELDRPAPRRTTQDDREDLPVLRPVSKHEREDLPVLRPVSKHERVERVEEHRPPPRPVRKSKTGGTSLVLPAVLLGGGVGLVVVALLAFYVIRTASNRPIPQVEPRPDQQAVQPPPRDKVGDGQVGGGQVGGQMGGKIPDGNGKVNVPPQPEPKNRDKLNLTRRLFEPGKGLKGPIVLDDWVVQCHTGGWEDYPMARMTHRLQGQALELTNDTGVINHAGIATRCYFEGDYSIKAEVRGAKSVGLKRAMDDRAYGGVYTPGDDWQTVVITRRAGVVSITVNGVPAKIADVNSQTLDQALFYVHVNEGAIAAVRWVEVSR